MSIAFGRLSSLSCLSISMSSEASLISSCKGLSWLALLPSDWLLQIASFLPFSTLHLLGQTNKRLRSLFLSHAPYLTFNLPPFSIRPTSILARTSTKGDNKILKCRCGSCSVSASRHLANYEIVVGDMSDKNCERFLFCLTAFTHFLACPLLPHIRAFIYLGGAPSTPTSNTPLDHHRLLWPLATMQNSLKELSLYDRSANCSTNVNEIFSQVNLGINSLSLILPFLPSLRQLVSLTIVARDDSTIDDFLIEIIEECLYFRLLRFEVKGGGIIQKILKRVSIRSQPSQSSLLSISAQFQYSMASPLLLDSHLQSLIDYYPFLTALNLSYEKRDCTSHSFRPLRQMPLLFLKSIVYNSDIIDSVSKLAGLRSLSLNIFCPITSTLLLPLQNLKGLEELFISTSGAKTSFRNQVEDNIRNKTSDEYVDSDKKEEERNSSILTTIRYSTPFDFVLFLFHLQSLSLPVNSEIAVHLIPYLLVPDSKQKISSLHLSINLQDCKMVLNALEMVLRLVVKENCRSFDFPQFSPLKSLISQYQNSETEYISRSSPSWGRYLHHLSISIPRNFLNYTFLPGLTAALTKRFGNWSINRSDDEETFETEEQKWKKQLRTGNHLK